MLNTVEIRRFLGKHGTHFLGVLPLDQLPMRPPRRRPYCFIVNLDPSYLPGTHWIAVYVGQNRRGEVFDSFGRFPPLSLSRWMTRNCYGWTYNQRLLQGPLTTLCGVYCIYFLHMRCFVTPHRNMHTIVREDFSNQFDVNDEYMYRFWRMIQY